MYAFVCVLKRAAMEQKEMLKLVQHGRQPKKTWKLKRYRNGEKRQGEKMSMAMKLDGEELQERVNMQRSKHFEGYNVKTEVVKAKVKNTRRTAKMPIIDRRVLQKREHCAKNPTNNDPI